jgi:citrate lyase subunit gamma (acyl carrier protein)
MIIANRAVAGSLESSDIFLEVLPYPRDVEIELSSIVMNQYGDAIRNVIRDELERLGVVNAMVKANDHGALECVIRARVETAVRRAAGEGAQ